MASKKDQNGMEGGAGMTATEIRDFAGIMQGFMKRLLEVADACDARKIARLDIRGFSTASKGAQRIEIFVSDAEKRIRLYGLAGNGAH